MPAALELASISKSFDGRRALDQASFKLEAGEVHALLGENGAGKSTLMNVAAGLYLPDDGEIRISGAPATIDNPLQARMLGVGMVHQHYKLVKSFNAVENILLSHAGLAKTTGAAVVEAMIRKQCAALGFEIDLRRPVGGLSIAAQQRVEIVKALIEGARILIMDEPTAVLTDAEAEGLLKTLRQLASQGAGVVLVTHKLGEVKGYADRVTIMRAGKTVASADPASLTTAELTTLVVGEGVTETRLPAKHVGAALLTISGLTGARSDGHVALSGASLELREGEIYGLAGVGGNGQTEFAEILMGVRKPLAGRIEMAGAGDVTHATPKRRRDLGFVAIPADRHTYGLAGALSVAQNYGVRGVAAGRFGGWLRVDGVRLRAQATQAVNAFNVRGVHAVRQKAGLLSGGNAQKLVIAREFADGPRIVLAHSPSRGLDVRATKEVHIRLREARDAGAAVLLISEDLDEILLLSDRIGVMSRGRIVDEFATPADRHAIGSAMVRHD